MRLKLYRNLLTAGFLTISLGVILGAAGRSSAQTTICKGSPLPTGFIIVSEADKMSCPFNTKMNAWSIKRPAATDIMCKNSPLPEGFVITGEADKYGCPFSTKMNAWEIKKP